MYQYRLTERWKVTQKDYALSINRRVSLKKYKCKRRHLGFISLNDWFPGSHAHHIDEEHIIYMPADLHMSVGHNVWTGEGMEAINTIAFRYITEEMFDKLIAGDI